MAIHNGSNLVKIKIYLCLMLYHSLYHSVSYIKVSLSLYLFFLLYIFYDMISNRKSVHANDVNRMQYPSKRRN